MLRFVLLETTMFDSGDNVKETRKDLVWLMEALCQRNQSYLRERPNTPRLYKSGVKYMLPNQMNGEVPEVAILRQALAGRADTKVRQALDYIQDALGGEHFRDIGRILENGGGDCDNLACWRVAELRQAGIAAKPYMTHRERLGGGTTYHALVLWPPIPGVPDWTSEDPSLLLGMGGEARAADRAEEIRKNAERCDLLRKSGMSAGNALDQELEHILGFKRGNRPAQAASKDGGVSANVVAEIERILKGAV